MPEARREVMAYRIAYICDDCGKGEMWATSVVIPTTPPKVLHECMTCRVRKVFEGVWYPIYDEFGE